MRPGGRILGLAAAWACLGSGCEYWDNFFQTKEPDQVDLVLSLKDAWTGEALPWASCSLDGVIANADAEGRITFPATATGTRTPECSCEYFHGRKVKLDAGPGRARFDVRMARKGFEDWYPGVPERQVRIDRHGGNLRFPGRMLVQAFPADTAPIFRYTWTSNAHGGLPSLRSLPVESAPLDRDFQQIVLTLTVTATLADTTYEVGKSTQSYLLARNQPPILSVGAFSLAGPERVGTGCEDKNLRIGFTASDPDGDSCRVRLVSPAASPLGRIDTSMACGYLFMTLPLQPHDGPPDVPTTREGVLEIQVRDENQGERDTAFQVGTYSNLHPLIRLEQVDAREKNRTYEFLRFHLFAKDRDAAMKSLVVDWKDGTREQYSPTFLSSHDSLDRILTHSYTKAGTYDVEASVSDGCGVTSRQTLRVAVEDNAVPEVSVQGLGLLRATQEYEIQVDASDGDAGSGLDSLNVVVEWWDHGVEVLTGRQIRARLKHAFKPDSTLAELEIRVSATDLYNGTASDTLRVKVADLVGDP